MKFSRVSLLSIYTILVVLSLLTISALAQTSRGTLTGTVTDSSHAVVPNATVKITQQGTGAGSQSTTYSSGISRFDAVELGIYTVAAEDTGFATVQRTGAE